MSYVFVLREAGIRSRSKPILSGVTDAFRNHAVTVLLGPRGSGSSLFLRALSGRQLPAGYSLEGGWLRLVDDPGDLWVSAAGHTGRGRIDWTKRVLLIDESLLAEGVSRRDLIARVEGHTRSGAVVLATEDPDFAREIADDVLLLALGEVACRGHASDFFAQPPGPIAAQFIAGGLLGPTRKYEVARLPTHWRWFVPGRLGGMARPGLDGGV